MSYSCQENNGCQIDHDKAVTKMTCTISQEETSTVNNITIDECLARNKWVAI